MKKKATLALLLLVPAASIGVAMAVFIAPGTLGQAVFALSKIWLFAFPGVWFFWLEKGKLKVTLPKLRESLVGIALGLVMFAAILGAYWFLGQQWIDAESTQAKAQQVGIHSPQIYLAGAVYFTSINALVEEYVWRWFVGRQCERLVPVKAAIFLSGFLFTLHHIIALVAYTDWRTAVLGSLGVFVAGSIWSWCYLTYCSIWPSYFSHILADLALAIVGWQILFR